MFSLKIVKFFVKIIVLLTIVQFRGLKFGIFGVKSREQTAQK